ncbi:MAG: transposase [Armatimonadetes bacterium]|nr:transposase [Armatimonadota bacterium]
MTAPQITATAITADEAEEIVRQDLQTHIREGMKALIEQIPVEQILVEEMTEHIGTGPRERTPSRKGERNVLAHAPAKDRTAGESFPKRRSGSPKRWRPSVEGSKRR